MAIHEQLPKTVAQKLKTRDSFITGTAQTALNESSPASACNFPLGGGLPFFR